MGAIAHADLWACMECCTFVARGGVRLCCGEGLLGCCAPCEPETSRARARSVHLRTACVRPCGPPWLRTSLLVPLPGANHQELVAPAPTCKCRRSGGERGRAKSIGVDRWASRTRRIAVQVAGGPWAASSSARSAHLCSPRRARRTRAERRKGASAWVQYTTCPPGWPNAGSVADII